MIDGEISEVKELKRGVRHRSIMSPDLFNMYNEVLLPNIEDFEGIEVGGRSMNNLILSSSLTQKKIDRKFSTQLQNQGKRKVSA